MPMYSMVPKSPFSKLRDKGRMLVEEAVQVETPKAKDQEKRQCCDLWHLPTLGNGAKMLCTIIRTLGLSIRCPPGPLGRQTARLTGPR